MWHSDRTQTQQRLAFSLSRLLLPLPASLFLPFLDAFWSTICTQYHLIDSLRIDKFLLLIRYYVNAAFTYLSCHDWDSILLKGYLKIVRGMLLEGQGKVPDGLRYHVLDVWIDELVRISNDKAEIPVEEVMEPVAKVKKIGRTKVLRERAREVEEDERLLRLGFRGMRSEGSGDCGRKFEIICDANDEWKGLGE